MTCGFWDRQWLRLKGYLLPPFYLLLAGISGAPGLGIRLRCARTGLRLLLTRRAPRETCAGLIFNPMDSTRYFEFAEVWKRAADFNFSRYLDVSSPRLLPLFLLESRKGAAAELLNPDPEDLRKTEELAKALGLSSRCAFFKGVLTAAGDAPASFDLITCLSVLEHIPDDAAAIKAMWARLRPGGKLILTLPCMARPLEQHISHNQYGVLAPEADGYTFWQRFYDTARLEAVIYPVTGKPAYISVYGEKEPGLFFRSASMKRLLGPFYPFWREPYMLAEEFKYFPSIGELPGEGVAALEFVKQGAPA